MNPMTPKAALELLSREFIQRFECDAESCADAKSTHEAMEALAKAVGTTWDCPSSYCKIKEGGCLR
jgi:hypothetical protein